LVSSLLGQGKTEAEVVKICKATAASVSKFNAAFLKGKTKTLKSFEGLFSIGKNRSIYSLFFVIIRCCFGK